MSTMIQPASAPSAQCTPLPGTAHLRLLVACLARPPWIASVGHLCPCVGFSVLQNQQLFLFWTTFEDFLLFCTTSRCLTIFLAFSKVNCRSGCRRPESACLVMNHYSTVISDQTILQVTIGTATRQTVW